MAQIGQKNSATQSLKWTTISSVIAMFAKVGQIVVLTRFLSMQDFGLVAIAVLFISFTEIFLDLGISSAVLHKLHITNDEYSSLFWLNIITGVILFILISLTAPLVSTYYKEKDLLFIVPVLSLTIIFSSTSKLQRTIQQKKMQFKFISVIEIIGSCILFLSSLLLAILGYRIYSLIYSTVIYSVFISIVYLYMAFFMEKNVRFHFSMAEVKSFLRIGVFQVGSSILDFFSSQMDILLISTVYSMEQLGAYSLFKQLAQRVYGFINPILTKVLTPMLSSLQNDKELIKEKYLQVVEMLSFINFPIYFLLAIVAPFLINILYGHAYVAYSSIFSILCIYYSILSIGNPVGSLQIAMGRTDIGFYWTIYRVAGNFIILYIGSFFSIYICISLLTLLTIFNIWPSVMLLFKKLANIDIIEYVSMQYRPFIISFVLAPLYFLQKVLPQNIVSLIIIGAIFLLGYTGLSYFFNFRFFNYIYERFGKRLLSIAIK